ncbi:MAG TPA: hypothetical protein ENI26_02130 [Methylophaga aminisulfidivorans]|uniref:DUF1351 domain-containing protein n=1 Tax=Methylophaga aminisulfidivorans TaxID=230105 RepID=A0A7C2A5U9_9GAMM|nr:hypothetical protein [Methylophaga aminisulfidivorans]
MSEITVIEIKQENALSIFTAEEGLDPYLKKIEQEARSLVPDMSTKKGRDQIASNAYKVRQSKSALDKVGKALVDKLKEQPKLVDAERKRMREFLDKLADEVRKPLDEFEQKEADRIKALQDRVFFFSSCVMDNGEESEKIKAVIETIELEKVDETYEEFEAEAHREKAACLDRLKSSLDKQIKHEAEQAELEKLRKEAAEREQKEREERIAREAEERARKQAEEAAQKERQDAINRENELKLAAERAEREKLEAEQRAVNAAKETEERLKWEAAEKARTEAEEQARRERNKKHKTKINNDALSALLTSGISEDQGKTIVTMIAKGEIPNVSISY